MAQSRGTSQPSRPDRNVEQKEPSMAKWQLGVLGVFLVVFVITAFLTGEPVYAIPVVILCGFVLLYAALNRAASQRLKEKHHGDVEEAVSDEHEDIPSAHLIADDDTALGDTSEAHDEITPHDLPLGHPGREAAEAQAGGEGGGTTTGNAQGGADGQGGSEGGDGAQNQQGRSIGRRA